MTELRVPNVEKELPIASAWVYVDEVDQSLSGDRETGSYVYTLLEEIIACDVGIYLMYHTSQLTTYSQSTAETLMSMSSKKKRKFLEVSGKKYINKNIW